MIKDSGEHKEEGTGTGAVRSSGEGRGRPSLLPFDALMEVSVHFEEGAAKYDDRNWEKGLKLSRYLDSMLRHVTDITMGDTSESHERAIAWNALCFLATWKRIQNGTLPAGLDDLPHHVASRASRKKHDLHKINEIMMSRDERGQLCRRDKPIDMSVEKPLTTSVAGARAYSARNIYLTLSSDREREDFISAITAK